MKQLTFVARTEPASSRAVYLRTYLLTVVIATLAAAGYALLRAGGVADRRSPLRSPVLRAVPRGGGPDGRGATVRSRSRLAAAVAFLGVVATGSR
jgi:hypothetical protein